MSSRLSCTVLLWLLSISIAGGAVWSFSASAQALPLAAVSGEAAEDAVDAKLEALPLPVVLTFEQLFFTAHCHAVIPDAVFEAVDRLLADDHGARGSPSV